MVTRRRLVLCAAILLTAGCKRDTQPSFAEEQQALDRDVAAWAQPFGANSDWTSAIGPFSVQVEDALRGKRLLLKGVSVADLIRRDDGHHALLGSDGSDALLGTSNVPETLRFLVSCTEPDVQKILTGGREIAGSSQTGFAFYERSVIDGIVEVADVRRVSSVDLEPQPDGDSARIESVARNRFLATGKLVALRVRPHSWRGRTPAPLPPPSR